METNKKRDTLQNERDLEEVLGCAEVAKILFVSDKLGLFEKCIDPISFDSLCDEMCVDKECFNIFLNALVALNILQKREGYYQNGNFIRKIFDDKEIYKLRYARYMEHALDNLYKIIKGGRKEIQEVSEDKVWYKAYAETMALSWGKVATHIVESIDEDNLRKMLDLGGGLGHYSLEFIKKYPNLTTVIVDKKEILEESREYLKGYEKRVILQSGDILTIEFGSGYDLVLASNILHYLDAQEIEKIVKKVYKCLKVCGMIVIHNIMLIDDYTPPLAAIFNSLYPLVLSKKGKVPYIECIKKILTQNGFEIITIKQMSKGSFLIVGKKRKM